MKGEFDLNDIVYLKYAGRGYVGIVRRLFERDKSIYVGVAFWLDGTKRLGSVLSYAKEDLTRIGTLSECGIEKVDW